MQKKLNLVAAVMWFAGAVMWASMGSLLCTILYFTCAVMYADLGLRG